MPKQKTRPLDHAERAELREIASRLAELADGMAVDGATHRRMLGIGAELARLADPEA